MALENNQFIMTLLNKNCDIDIENNTFIIDNIHKEPVRKYYLAVLDLKLLRQFYKVRDLRA